MIAASRRYPQRRALDGLGRTGARREFPADARQLAGRAAPLRDPARRGLRRAEERQRVEPSSSAATPTPWVWSQRAEVRALDEAAERQAAAADYLGHNPFSTRIPRLSAKPYAKYVRDFSDLDTYAAEIPPRLPGPQALPQARAEAVAVRVHGLQRPCQPRVRFLRQPRRAGDLADGRLPDRRSLAVHSPASAGTRCSTMPVSVTNGLTTGLMT